ncbi:hypothetical protein LIER_41183 [Lithospermum erythrorhizon]|uniref:Uncharacterized protein n=1 Tax=Lithospermum erythrorhizon TaxID=34254 RepID=A0AAV3R7C3_LITER
MKATNRSNVENRNRITHAHKIDHRDEVKKPQIQGRVFGLTKQDAIDSNAVVSGMIQIGSFYVHALFDPGANHSFMTSLFAGKIGRVSEPLEFELCLSTLLGVYVMIDHVFKNCVIKIDCYELLADFVKLNMCDLV